ncbi:MAG: hypothetical protein ACRC10_06830 [Thermoguttaceae bacterium]
MIRLAFLFVLALNLSAFAAFEEADSDCPESSLTSDFPLGELTISKHPAEDVLYPMYPLYYDWGPVAEKFGKEQLRKMGKVLVNFAFFEVLRSIGVEDLVDQNIPDMMCFSSQGTNGFVAFLPESGHAELSKRLERLKRSCKRRSSVEKKSE